MIRWMIMLCVGLLLALTEPGAALEIGPFQADRAEEDGLLLARTVKDFNRPKTDLVLKSVMTLKRGEEAVDVRKVLIKEKTDGDLSRALLRFMDSLKRGITFLTIETHGPDNDQYIYLPAIGRPRKIASQDRQNDFEDTDFTNEDLGGRKIEDYTYQRRQDAALSGTDCFRYVATAKDASARFPRHTVWVDKESRIPMQVVLTGRDNRTARIMVSGDIRKIGGIHIPFKVVSRDVKGNHTTILDVTEALVDQGVDPGDFDPARMGEVWKERF